jgi:hypothetical protein
VSDGTQLVRYDAMCRAIQEAHAVDEVKDIRDKARALEMYFRQARNKEAEEQARNIRLRGERKGGELLADMEKAASPGWNQHRGRSDDTTDHKTLSDLGISKQQSSDWQKLAAIPEAEFEADLADPMWHPSTAGLIERHEARERGPLPTMRVDDGALWLWGRLQDFEDDGLLQRDPDELLSTMLEHMEETTRRLAPRVAAWLGRIR